MAVDASSSIFDSFWVQHSIPCLNDEEHCILNVGGVDLGLHCSDHHKNPAKFDTNKMAQIIADHIILGKFDVFCVQRISTAVLNTVLGIVKEADKAWESTNCANPYHDAPSMSHVIFYKTTVMVFVTKTISVLKGDKFYERIVKEFHKFFGEGLVDELPVDSSGFVGIYKLVAIDRYVKIMSLALPPLTKETPPRHKHGELFWNLSLKKALFTLFCSSDRISPKDTKRKSIYFVYGSIEVIAGMDLLNSSVHRIFTGDKVIMILPQDDIDSFEQPNPPMVFIGNMQYFDPEREVPLRKQGLSSFIYFKGARILTVYKYQTMGAASGDRGIYDYPCGGRFLMFPIPRYSTSEDTTDASDGEPYADLSDAAEESTEESIHGDPDETSDESTVESIHEDPDETSEKSTEESTVEETKQSKDDATKESADDSTIESTARKREESTADATKESAACAREESPADKTDGKPIETEKPAEATEESTVEKQEKSRDGAEESGATELKQSTAESIKESTAESTEESKAGAREESTAYATKESTAEKTDGKPIETEKPAEATEESTVKKQGKPRAEATEKSTDEKQGKQRAEAKQSTASESKQSTDEAIKETTEQSISEATEKSTEQSISEATEKSTEQSTAGATEESTKQSTAEAIEETLEKSAAEAAEQSLAEPTNQSKTKNKLVKKQKIPAQHCPKRRKPKKK